MKQKLIDFYLEYVNTFGTVERIAENYGMTNAMTEVLLAIGKQLTAEKLKNEDLALKRKNFKAPFDTRFDIYKVEDINPEDELFGIMGGDVIDELDLPEDPLMYLLFSKGKRFYIGLHLSGKYSTTAGRDSAFGTLEECIKKIDEELEEVFPINLNL